MLDVYYTNLHSKIVILTLHTDAKYLKKLPYLHSKIVILTPFTDSFSSTIPTLFTF